MAKKINYDEYDEDAQAIINAYVRTRQAYGIPVLPKYLKISQNYKEKLDK